MPNKIGNIRTPISFNGYNLAYLAKKFPSKAPTCVQKAFEEAISAMRLPKRRYRLVYIPRRAVQWCIKQGPGGIEIGQLGCAVNNIAFVCHSDKEGRKGERIVAMHEAMHFAFGSHPWPHEKSYV